MCAEFRPVTTAELASMTMWELRRLVRALGGRSTVAGTRPGLLRQIKQLTASAYQEDVRVLVDATHREYADLNPKGAAARQMQL